ncbi:dTDP-4-dehydrorhamnose reductase [Halomonas alkaliantarctica]|nr:dTDP-4-dehydrorhamnose reductase [Halomonas alkaliantarctica]
MNKLSSKVLITGGSGQVGFELRRQLCLMGEIMAPARGELDLTDARAVNAYLERHRPDLIINAAAYTAVDKAESEHETAQRLNAALPAQLANYCTQHGAGLVHYSSDYVYSGQGDAGWQEAATPDPQNTYGRTKLEGDNAIIQSGCEHHIFRTSWVVSGRGGNFVHTMLRLGRERDALNIVADQIGAPTPARLIAQITALAIAPQAERVAPRLAPGLYHLAPRGETSWYGIARETFRLAREQGVELAITPQRLTPITTAEYPTPAPRPLNSRLSLVKLEQGLGITLPDWHAQLALTVEEQLVNYR